MRLTVTIIVRGLFCWRLDDAAILQLGFREGAQPIAYTKGIMVIILAMIILIIMVIVIIMITARPKQRRRFRSLRHRGLQRRRLEGIRRWTDDPL